MVWLRRIAWALTGMYWGVMFALTHLPPEKIAGAPKFWDKAEHFVAYFLLAALLGSALMFTFPRRRGIPVWVLVIGMSYAVVDELLQPLVRRDAEVNDWVADALGVWTAVFILWAVRKVLVARRAMPGPGFPAETASCNSSSSPTTSRT
jgi:VanZ family protein